jgi:hypothetical protein
MRTRPLLVPALFVLGACGGGTPSGADAGPKLDGAGAPFDASAGHHDAMTPRDGDVDGAQGKGDAADAASAGPDAGVPGQPEGGHPPSDGGTPDGAHDAPTSDAADDADDAGDDGAFPCLPTDAGGCLVQLAQGLQGATAVTLDSSYVYWGARNAVIKEPLAGGTMTTLAPAAQAMGLALDGVNVYWTQCGEQPDCEGGSVQKVGLTGGAVTTLAYNQSEPIGIAVDSTNVFWTNYGYIDDGFGIGSVNRTALDGTNQTFIDQDLYGASALAINASRVYYQSAYPGYGGAIGSAALAGGSVVTLETDGCDSGLAIDATSIYWASCGTGGAYIYKADLTGGLRTTLASYPGYGNTAFAVDSTHLYWTNSDLGIVAKTDLAGTTTTTLATGQAESTSIAVDGTSVYWTSSANGTVMRLTPK